MDVKTDEENVLRKDFIIEIKRRWDGLYQSFYRSIGCRILFWESVHQSQVCGSSADQYFDDSELMDLKVMGTMGLTKADIRANWKGIGN